MHARTRRAATRAAVLLAVAGACALAAAACFPSFEFPGDDDGEGGAAVHVDGGGGGSLDGNVSGGGDAGDATTSIQDASAAPLDATTDAPRSTTSVDSGAPDSAADAAIRVDLELLLHLDDSTFTGAGAIKDSSGNGNNGSQAGNVSGTSPTSSGKFGGAASFNGTGWIEVPSSASLTLTSKFTLAAWVNYGTALGGNVSPGIIVNRQGVGFASYTLFIWNNDSAVQAYVDVENTRLNSTPQVQMLNTWYHLAAVYDGTVPSVTVYVNGVATAPTTTGVPGSLGPSTVPVRIGDLPDGGNTLTNGKIDEVAIWSRALSAAEVMSLWTATGPL